MTKSIKKCKACGQIINVKESISLSPGKYNINIKANKIEPKEIKKLKRIMKNHKLSQVKLSIILGIAQTTVSAWLRDNSSTYGNIKSKYFDILKKEGYL